MSAIIRRVRAVEAARAGFAARVVVPFQHFHLPQEGHGRGVRLLDHHDFKNTQQQLVDTAFSRAFHGHHRYAHAGLPSNVAASTRGSDCFADGASAAFHSSSPSGSAKSTPTTESASSSSSDAASDAPAGKKKKAKNTVSDYMLFHPQYDMDKIADITPSHRPPTGIRDWATYGAVQFSRSCFDRLTGYSPDAPLSREQWLTRFIFLETVAGVPGMVAAMLRHMVSLRTLKRDHGWIHTLLEEAENERMHLLTFMQLKNPGLGFRLAVLGAQGVFFNAFLAAYIITPRSCHRFVGYLEEEAVKTYTHAIHDIDREGSDAAAWASTPAPEIAVHYWKLDPGATVRDVVMAVRADEAGTLGRF